LKTFIYTNTHFPASLFIDADNEAQAEKLLQETTAFPETWSLQEVRKHA